MGRYNNARTQAAAEALKNTPSRARFSKGPPNKGQRSKTNINNASNDKDDKNNASSNRPQQQRPKGHLESTARVIDKLQSRQLQQQQQPRTATFEEALDHVDRTKYDRLQLPEDVLKNVTDLLERLGVMESKNDNGSPRNDNNSPTLPATTEVEEDLVIADPSLSAAARPFVGGTVGAYSEYEDDAGEEEDFEDYHDYQYDVDKEFADDNDNEEDIRIWGQDDSVNEDQQEPDDETQEKDHMESNPAFVYLTERLSFSQTDARRACRAIEDWEAISDGLKGEKKDTVALAMDWLCLHLDEAQLTRGFKPSKNPTKAESLMSRTGVPLVGSGIIRVIAHPSISLATDILSDKAWARSVRRQERILKFVRLGFSHAEATDACENTASKDDAIDVKLTKQPPLDDPALPLLLASLRSKVAGKSFDAVLNETDLQFAAEERENEREALKAIFENNFQVLAGERYCIKINPVEPLKEPARSDDCRLHVFMRPGYPVVETALFWFVNSSLPPSLLRQINEFAAKQSLDGLGLPSVFEAVNALTDALPDLQLAFIREQRRIEFEAEQARMRKEVGHTPSQAVEKQDENEKLGRRQRAKIKAAEKAFDRGDQHKKNEEDRLQRQELRVQRAKVESTRVRDAYVQQTLLKREKERIEEETERAARSAMSLAFNRGASVEQARLAAAQAKAAYLREQGEEDDPKSESKDMTYKAVDSSSSDHAAPIIPTARTTSFMERLRGEVVEKRAEVEEADAAAPSRGVVLDATPTTMAFMERLRQMYDAAAQKKAGYHLATPVQKDSSEHAEHFPRPIAAPTGEMLEVMNSVLKIQQEQPWLISPEARVPTVLEVYVEEALSVEQQQKQESISRQLKQDLERKLHTTRDRGERRKHSGGDAKRGESSMSAAESYHLMLSIRQKLPAFMMAREIVDTIASNQVTVIAGDTGCGKTTQVPQLVLDDRILKGLGAATNIIVTQPRRISAIGVSERIAAERAERVGETCGYSIKLEKRMSSKTRILLCTTGILLRRLQCDPDLASVSHIFVDEVHERDLNTDFLIIILRDLLARRKNLKLVLMSATLNADAFSSYFSGCPVVTIPGRAHPVKENRLEDIFELTKYQVIEGSDYARKIDDKKPPKVSKSQLRNLYHPKYSKETINALATVNEDVINYELIACLLEHIALNEDEGAVLVFVPGLMEITKTIDELYKKEFFQSNKVRIFPLHSSLTTAEQVAIFEVPPTGVRKVVVSTNIAETSITIEDVVFVVDSAKVKENRRDEMNETPTLVECWASRAAVKQRRGRAGRVRPGIAYHLYSSHTYDNELADYQLPEMLRVGIEDLVLQVLVLDLGEPSKFLGKALNPPSDLALSNSLQLLETLGAVECTWAEDPSQLRSQHGKASGSPDQCSGQLQVTSELTALGFHLATLPVDPRVGKLIIYGSLLGCVDPALTIAAGMTVRSPFLSPFDQREAADGARRSFAVEGSDHLTVLNAFGQWKQLKDSKKGNQVVNTFLKENFLGRQTLHQMEDLKKQFTKLLKDIGFLPVSYEFGKQSKAIVNANNENLGLVKAVLCAGLYPNILVAPRTLVQQGFAPTRQKNSQKVGEFAFQSRRKGEVYLHPSTIAFNQSALDSRFCCYHEIVKTSKTYARDATTVSPFAMLLFGGSLKVHHAHGIVSVDGWLHFRLDAKPATLIKYLRDQMEKILLQKIVNPQVDVFASTEGRALIESISILFGCKELIPVSDAHSSGGEIVRPWTRDADPDDSRDRGQHLRSGSSDGGRRSGRGRGGRGGRSSGRGGRSSGRGGPR